MEAYLMARTDSEGEKKGRERAPSWAEGGWEAAT